MQSIVFLHNIDSQELSLWQQSFKQHLVGEQVLLDSELSDEQAAEVEVAIVANPDPSQLARYPNLVWVQSLWAGVESLVSSFRQLATNSAGQELKLVRLIDPQLAQTMAEAVLAWTLYLHRQMPEYAAQQKQKLWRQLHCPTAASTRVSVLGSGKLGTAAMQVLLRQGYQVNSWSRTQKQIDGANHYFGYDQLPNLLSQTDILVCLLPLTDETRGLLNQTVFEALPTGAKVINFARGAVVNHSDLVAALNTKQLDHAVLDVFEVEPLPAASELWEHPQITVLPHISAMTNVETATQVVAKNIAQYRNSGKLPVTVEIALGY